MARQRLQPATTYRAIVGRVLAELRSQVGLRQAQVAEQIGLTQSAWSRIERGTNALSLEQMRQAASALGRSPSEIVSAAERIEKALRRKGVRVEASQPASQLGRGIAIIGLAALAGVVITALSKESK